MKPSYILIVFAAIALAVAVVIAVRLAYRDVYPASLPQATDDNSGWYVVKSWDTFSNIAEVFYGDSNYWRPLRDANEERHIQVSPLQPGQEILILGAKRNTDRLLPIEASTTPEAARLNFFQKV